MAPRKFILICQSGGKFVESKDGNLSYTGGEAHAVGINCDTRYDELKLELIEMWNLDIDTMAIKYFLPGNKRTLITVSNDKDLQRMVEFHEDSASVDVYLVPRDGADRDIPKKKSAGRRNKAKGAALANHRSSPTASVDPSLIVNAPPSAGTSDTSGTNCILTVASPVATIPVSSAATGVVSADAVFHIGSPTNVHIGSPTNDVASVTTSSCANGDIAVDTRKVGSDGVTIVSVIDSVQQQVYSDDFELQRYTASGENELDSVSIVDADDFRQQGLLESWKTGITGVGQIFSGVNDLRDALRNYAIAHRFRYKFKKNDGDRVCADCEVEGCSWKIAASRVPVDRSWKIKKFTESHSCGDVRTSVNPQASKHWIASVVKDKLQDHPHYTPQEIASDISRDFGIELSYKQAWRGMEIARKQLQGSYTEAYNLLPWYCEKVVEMNPGSAARFTTKDDLSFQRLFISYHASLHGFQNGCRPILFLEATSLKSKYQEMLLAAIAVDGDDGTFPVALAVVDVEDDENWRWFLEQLKSVLSKFHSLTFVSDKQKGLSKPILEMFENAHIGYYVHCLLEDFKRDIKGPFHGDRKSSLIGNFYTASQALLLDEFRKCTESIKEVSPAAYEWVTNSEPECWANSQFRGERYHQIKLDDIQSFANWIAEVRELPIVRKMDMIRFKMMQLIYTRQEYSSKWSTKLTPSKEAKLQEESEKAHALKVLIASTSVFEVHGDCIKVVNIDQCECSCRAWKQNGLPCSHAIAAFNCTGKSPYDYCSEYFMADTFRLTYSESINPILEMGKFESKESSGKLLVHPPCSRSHQPQSRPKRKPTDSSHEVVKRPLHCSKCKGVGHNMTTCKQLDNPL